jgi:copper chaperone CopZ
MPTTTTLTISGMSCSHCVAAVTRHLSALDGVTVREVEVGRAVIDADPARVTPEALAAAIGAAGFTLDPVPASLAGDDGASA